MAPYFVALLAAWLLLGCSLLSERVPTDPRPREQLPGPGSVFVRIDPVPAQRDIVLRYQESDGDLTSYEHSFSVGDDVRVVDGLSVGRYRILIDQIVCDGGFDVELRRETDVLLVDRIDSCAVIVMGAHDDAQGHGLGRVIGSLADGQAGITVRLVPTVTVGGEWERETASDESGTFVFDDVPAGTYTLEARQDGVVVGSALVSVPADGTVSAAIRRGDAVIRSPSPLGGVPGAVRGHPASHAASHGGHTRSHGVEHVDDGRAGNLRRVP